MKAEKLDFIGQSGYLLVEVGAYNDAAKRAPVNVHLIPNVGELAMEAKDGVLVQRSHVALFSGLARRPRSGGEAGRFSTINESVVYIPIPANCVGSRCAGGIAPEYTFSSSREDIGDFVAPNLPTGNPRAVLPNAEGNPTHDPKSGLFCAYNAGTTVVTISAGGLSAMGPVLRRDLAELAGGAPQRSDPARDVGAALRGPRYRLRRRGHRSG